MKMLIICRRITGDGLEAFRGIVQRKGPCSGQDAIRHCAINKVWAGGKYFQQIGSLLGRLKNKSVPERRNLQILRKERSQRCRRVCRSQRRTVRKFSVSPNRELPASKSSIVRPFGRELRNKPPIVVQRHQSVKHQRRNPFVRSEIARAGFPRAWIKCRGICKKLDTQHAAGARFRGRLRSGNGYKKCDERSESLTDRTPARFGRLHN